MVYVGAAMGSHKIYRHCCVIDFASLVKDIRSIIREDCVMRAKDVAMSNEFRMLLNSIPIENLTEEIQKQLNEDMEVSGYCNY